MFYDFTNPFSQNNVYIIGDFTDGFPIKLYKHSRRRIYFSISGLLKYNYIIDGNFTYCPDKLHCIDEKGVFYNYLIVNNVDIITSIYLQSVALMDIDIHYNNKMCYDFDALKHLINNGNYLAAKLPITYKPTISSQLYDLVNEFYDVIYTSKNLMGLLYLARSVKASGNIPGAQKLYSDIIILYIDGPTDCKFNEYIYIDALVEFADISNSLASKIQYYDMAIKKGCVDAIFKRGNVSTSTVDKIYYWNLATKYYYIPAIMSLGNHFHNVKRYDDMIYYYNMAADMGHKNAISLLKTHYGNVQKNFVLYNKYSAMMFK